MAGDRGRRQEAVAGGRGRSMRQKAEASLEIAFSSSLLVICCQLFAVSCSLLRFEVVGDSSDDVAGAGKFFAREGCFPCSLDSCRTKLRIATRGAP